MEMIFNSIITDTFTIQTYLICLLVAFICGLISAFVASYKSYVTKSFLISLIVLPMIVETIIMMVNGNVGTGVAVMGAFSLVRFRSVPGKAKDISMIFLTMTAGLACAAGYIGIAFLFTLLVSIVMIVLAHIFAGNERYMDLRITVPETLSYANSFDDIFQTYCNSSRLIKVKTTNMGSLYRLLYRVELKDLQQSQKMIDELRCRNGNLEILLSESEGVDEL